MKYPQQITKIARSLLLSAAALGSASNVYAQSLELEEVVVTAQKKAESIQDVPISITAFTGDSLNKLGINETDQLGQFIPGLEISTSSGEGSQLIAFLRGAGLNDFNTNNAGPIGIYADEVYVSSPALTAFQLFDTERLEILKGPQGTLYGRNTTGGAIKFVSNKPTEEFSGYARIQVENFGTTAIEGAVSGSLSDTVKGRVAFIKNDSDGFVDNLLTGEDSNGSDSGAYRAMLEFTPNDSLRVLANIHGARVDSPSTDFSPLGIINPATGAPCNVAMIQANQCLSALGYQAPDDPFQGNYNNDGKVDLQADGGYLEVSYDTPGFTFTSVTAYDELERSLPEESDASPLEILQIDYGVSSETFSQELRINGSTDKIDWLAGAFYLTEDLVQDQTLDLFGSLRVFTGGLSDPTGSVTGAPILFARSFNTQKLDTFALFGQLTFALNDKLNLTVGGRYTDEEREFSARGQLEDVATFGPTPFTVYQFDNQETGDDAFSYRLALDYAPNDSTLLYSSISRGFKSGGFNGGFLSLDPSVAEVQIQPFDAEFLTAYEIGVKTDLLDGRLRLNTAIFLNEFSDLQVFTLINNGTLPIQVLDNASDAESKGIEIEATALLSEGLTASLSAAFMDSELQNFISSTAGENFSGNQIANTPESSVSGLVNYDHALSSGAYINVQGSFAYKDDVFFSTENNPLVAQESYTLVNARLGYTSASEAWSIYGYVNNLTDEAYATNITDTTDITASYVRTFALPRTYGIEFNFSF